MTTRTAKLQERGRAECRDGHSFRGIDARSVHVLDECSRCGYLRFAGRGLAFEPRRADMLVVWGGGRARWDHDDTKLREYSRVENLGQFVLERVAPSRWAIKKNISTGSTSK